MDEYQKSYYQKMLERDRLVPIMFGSKMVGFITYYIGSITDKYVRDDPWSILDDCPESGTICFVDQLITNKEAGNWKHSRRVWRNFRDFIKNRYPKVHVIRWNRVKQGEPHVYYFSIKRQPVQQASL
jgi:hypothetical protein